MPNSKLKCHNCGKSLELTPDFHGDSIECPICDSRNQLRPAPNTTMANPPIPNMATKGYLSNPPPLSSGGGVANRKGVASSSALVIVAIIVGAFLLFKKNPQPSGDPEEMYQLGLRHRQSENHALAAEYFDAAARAGHLDAQVCLGEYFLYGDGVQQDYRLAVQLFAPSAEQGIPIAQVYLGICHKKGLGVDQNYREAFFWFSESAKQGYANGQFHVGLCYLDSIGVSNNEPLAIEYLRDAAKQGHREAAEILQTLEQGRNPPPKDELSAENIADDDWGGGW